MIQSNIDYTITDALQIVDISIKVKANENFTIKDLIQNLKEEKDILNYNIHSINFKIVENFDSEEYKNWYYKNCKNLK